MKAIIKKYIVKNERGLHARMCARFINVTNDYDCRLRVTKDRETVDGKSIIGVLTLAASCGSTLMVRIEGERKERNGCAEELQKLFDLEEETV